ncbi:hypothetical protein RJO53_003032 [Enterobacter hormaechei]|uniref:hypothetical protein n=1 Tax=Enterobacter hormaechei TaxID=158836 RepID=UPI000798A186|nr:hypothetical protein [Enterobacter hormaechei]HCT5582475.1 hypothetical protein [Enterobacter kobei]HDT5169947.1 hypothetical protein [Enterobacter hormaechei subsp. steigerwaltii]ELC6297111.1 hypothetical protein [Enterobacter hormaechei]ELC6543360.1 hypothetical protein [Enterobacter hormaechei]CZW65401.1 Uncharacterised protein [Enterobacter hormaechei]
MHDHSDYSDLVFHWIKTDYWGDDIDKAYEGAFDVMLRIIDDGFLRASGKDTFKSIESVCFTESPKEVMKHQTSRYMPFGFSFEKSYLFEQGGRHVIYQTKEEGIAMPSEMHWRHVTYNPNETSKRKEGIDFTWEREWRLNKSQLSILDINSVIVPNQDYVERLVAEIEHMKGFPDYMWDKIREHVDPGPYRKYTPEFIDRFDVMYS